MLQMNLDEFNALCGAAFTEADRSALLGGLQLGCNGGQLPEGCSKVVRSAFEVGSKWRAEAEGFAASSSLGGKRSAEVRREKYGTANPKGVRRGFEGGSEGGSEGGPNQPTTHNPQSNKPKTKNQPIPEGLVPRLEALCRDWPGSFTKDGQTHRLPKLNHAQDLWDRMTRFFPGDNPLDMIAAGEKHIAPQKADEWSFEAKPKGFTIAMTNFYGQQARWKEFR